jgi:ABC-type transport system involved in Fe-S cluster assembly fused permease/ATPase subunit
MNTTFLIIFILLQIADIWTTLRALELGHREMNPLLNWMFKHVDPLAAMVLVKVVGLWALWYVDLYLLTMAVCAVYVWVVTNNWKVIGGR